MTVVDPQVVPYGHFCKSHQVSAKEAEDPWPGVKFKGGWLKDVIIQIVQNWAPVCSNMLKKSGAHGKKKQTRRKCSNALRHATRTEL